jgi:hypothetical protein
MKLAIVIISLVAALALPATAEAKPTRTTSIDATLVGTGCGNFSGLDCFDGGQGGSCLCLSTTWNFAGNTKISPPLGPLAFTGTYSDGYFCSEEGPGQFECLVTIYFRSLTLTLTAANGDKLVLRENFASTTRILLLSLGQNPAQGAWNVDPARSTGRFTHYTGSGTYTLSVGQQDPLTTDVPFTLELAGSLTFGRRT